MTLAECIALADQMRPSQFDKDMMTGWINEIENQVVKEIMNRSLWDETEFTPYVYDEDSETELKVPDTHRDIYLTYLFSKIDYTNGEIQRYNADMTMHKSAWESYAKEYRREHYPKPYDTSVHTILLSEE